MYKLAFEKKALHDLNRLETKIKERIWNKLQDCKEDPFRLERVNFFLLILYNNLPGKFVSQNMFL